MEGGSGGDAGTVEDKAQKKARSFDFMAMFEQARQTAIERTKDNTAASHDEVEGQAEIPKQTSTKVTFNAKKTSAASDESSDDEIGPPLPKGFGNKQAKGSGKEDDSDDDIGPPLPPGMKSYDSEDDSEEEEENPVRKIPTSHEIQLDHGTKTLSALALDPSGARLVTGGYDYDVKFWDFAGMDSSLQSFRNIRPCEGYPVKQLQYSATGENILVVTGNSQAKVIDRDGFVVLECVRGDVYLVDMAKTKGHIATLNSGCWNPKIREEFLTCSNDGSVRLWDVNSQGRNHKNIMKPRTQQGRKVIPTACAYSPDGRYVAAACQDGSIQLWDHNKMFVNVALMNRTAHMNGSDTSCLCFSYDGKTLASRGGDDTLKTWDIRNFKTPLKSLDGLTNFFPVTDCLFSPDDRLLVTGLSVKKGEGKGKLLFFDRESLEKVSEMEISDTSVVRCLWHPKLNQMVVGCGDGQARLFYDPEKSNRGAMLCVVKKQRKSKQVEIMASQQIITPYALPMFRQGRPTSTRKIEERLRKDPGKSKKPELPMDGPGEGGRLGAKGATLSQYIVQQLVVKKPTLADVDPRAAILRHAQDAKEHPYWIDPAYKKTQPETIFQKEDTSKDDDDDEPEWKKTKLR
ncbi:hypothetical protein ScPMuIL_005572 [Solemya velum]